ncbi:hypothetical protein [Actinophytocola sp.]|uniref:hypothetical protein n=1 Tax=Actinophytocola sp. TaxID=1872138 RepID=UPI0039C8AB62
MIISLALAVVGEVRRVRPHPQGDFIWLAEVCLGNCADQLQIVFGGDRQLSGDELVPVAPSRLSRPRRVTTLAKMRARNYRGQRSQGMLCSLEGLGWLRHGPNEVAVLCKLEPGYRLDDLDAVRRARSRAGLGGRRDSGQAEPGAGSGRRRRPRGVEGG